MDSVAVGLVRDLIDILKVGGPYAIMVIEGFVIWKLWQKNEKLHEKLEKRK